MSNADSGDAEPEPFSAGGGDSEAALGHTVHSIDQISIFSFPSLKALKEFVKNKNLKEFSRKQIARATRVDSPAEADVDAEPEAKENVVVERRLTRSLSKLESEAAAAAKKAPASGKARVKPTTKPDASAKTPEAGRRYNTRSNVSNEAAKTETPAPELGKKVKADRSPAPVSAHQTTTTTATSQTATASDCDGGEDKAEREYLKRLDDNLYSKIAPSLEPCELDERLSPWSSAAENSEENHVDVENEAADERQSTTTTTAATHQAVIGPAMATPSSTPTFDQTAAPECGNEHCRLGCICDALNVAGVDSTASSSRSHCGRFECMFECSCVRRLRSSAKDKSGAGASGVGGEKGGRESRHKSSKQTASSDSSVDSTESGSESGLSYSRSSSVSSSSSSSQVNSLSQSNGINSAASTDTTNKTQQQKRRLSKRVKDQSKRSAKTSTSSRSFADDYYYYYYNNFPKPKAKASLIGEAKTPKPAESRTDKSSKPKPNETGLESGKIQEAPADKTTKTIATSGSTTQLCSTHLDKLTSSCNSCRKISNKNKQNNRLNAAAVAAATVEQPTPSLQRLESENRPTTALAQQQQQQQNQRRAGKAFKPIRQKMMLRLKEQLTNGEQLSVAIPLSFEIHTAKWRSEANLANRCLRLVGKWLKQLEFANQRLAAVNLKAVNDWKRCEIEFEDDLIVELVDTRKPSSLSILNKAYDLYTVISPELVERLQPVHVLIYEAASRRVSVGGGIGGVGARSLSFFEHEKILKSKQPFQHSDLENKPSSSLLRTELIKPAPKLEFTPTPVAANSSGQQTVLRVQPPTGKVYNLPRVLCRSRFAASEGGESVPSSTGNKVLLTLNPTGVIFKKLDKMFESIKTSPTKEPEPSVPANTSLSNFRPEKYVPGARRDDANFFFDDELAYFSQRAPLTPSGEVKYDLYNPFADEELIAGLYKSVDSREIVDTVCQTLNKMIKVVCIHSLAANKPAPVKVEATTPVKSTPGPAPPPTTTTTSGLKVQSITLTPVNSFQQQQQQRLVVTKVINSPSSTITNESEKKIEHKILPSILKTSAPFNLAASSSSSLYSSNNKRPILVTNSCNNKTLVKIITVSPNGVKPNLTTTTTTTTLATTSGPLPPGQTTVQLAPCIGKPFQPIRPRPVISTIASTLLSRPAGLDSFKMPAQSPLSSIASSSSIFRSTFAPPRFNFLADKNIKIIPNGLVRKTSPVELKEPVSTLDAAGNEFSDESSGGDYEADLLEGHKRKRKQKLSIVSLGSTGSTQPSASPSPSKRRPSSGSESVQTALKISTSSLFGVKTARANEATAETSPPKIKEETIFNDDEYEAFLIEDNSKSDFENDDYWMSKSGAEKTSKARRKKPANAAEDDEDADSSDCEAGSDDDSDLDDDDHPRTKYASYNRPLAFNDHSVRERRRRKTQKNLLSRLEHVLFKAELHFYRHNPSKLEDIRVNKCKTKIRILLGAANFIRNISQSNAHLDNTYKEELARQTELVARLAALSDT